MTSEELVKENRLVGLPLTWRWLAGGLALSACAALGVLRLDHALPPPRARHSLAAHPERFIAEIAHEHVVNLTSIGPRVAGSYENEVLAVGLLVAAVRRVAALASPHNRVELDVHRASGNFSLTFMDGMNNVYRDVQSVVARVSGVGAREPRSAILLNCHFDTVPDSPGASDDGAGCAVMLETMRALAATRRPLRHDAVFLFNGAEENIMQASHAFITQHKWAKSVRAFINIEACGAGGREVMFQAGPHEPWIVEVYAGAVPHPFASSLAQELFESGLIPADTDFRIFRDFGKLSGVDLAWNANGYVYHTRLDTADNVPPAALQRTGDNVLALAHGLLASASVEAEADSSSRQPAFFDVLGAVVVSARAPAAAALAAATVALVLLKVQLNARAARRRLYVRARWWWARVLGAAGARLLAAAAGVLAAVAPALLLHALGARLTFYARPLLLVPLYVLPGVAASWALAARRGGAAPALRGWWRARAWHDAGALLAAAALAGCALRGLRSGFLPLLWALLPAGADVLAVLLRAPGAARAALWAAGGALPLLQTCYLLLSLLRTAVPLMGRAGAGPLPADVAMAVITSSLALCALRWLLPFVVAARRVRPLLLALAAAGAAAAALLLLPPLRAPYSAARPQRLMLFHTRRTLHAAAAPPRRDTFYWVPELDANTRATLDEHVRGDGPARALAAAECARLLYCGAPYFLPVLSLVGRSHAVPVRAEPAVRLEAELAVVSRGAGTRVLLVNVTRAPAHVVLIVSPAAGAALVGSSAVARPLAGRAWGARAAYFFALHAARAPAAWQVELEFAAGEGALAAVSLAGHAMFGAERLSAEHARALHALPPHVAGTGWGVDLHVYDV